MIRTLLQWQIDWQILKAQKWRRSQRRGFNVRESSYRRGLQTLCWTMIS